MSKESSKEEARENADKVAAWERHISSIIGGLVLLGIATVFSYVKDNPAELAKMQGQINVLSNSVANLNQRITYNLQNTVTREEFSALKTSYIQLESKVRELESAQRRFDSIQTSRGPKLEYLEKVYDKLEKRGKK